MTNAADIKDRESLEAWLETRSQEEAVWIAMRAAARVLPVWWATNFNKVENDNAGLYYFRCLLVSSEASQILSDELAEAAMSAADAAADVQAFAASYASEAAAASTVHGGYNDAAALIDPIFVASRACLRAVMSAGSNIRAVILPDAETVQSQGNRLAPLFRSWRDPLPQMWQQVISRIPSGEGTPDYHSFWLPWYEDLYHGKPSRFPPELLNAIALISHDDPDDWAKGDLHINNTVIPALMDEHMPGWWDGSSGETALVEATPFTFEQLEKVMRLVGIDDDMRHLREPSVVLSFLDDAEETKDSLQDFCDDATELQGGNFAGVLKRRAERVLREFASAQEHTYLRARRLVQLSKDLELMSKDQKAKDDLGDTLHAMLVDRIEGLKGLCRRHFGPAYTSLAPLAQLTLEHVDQDEVIGLFDGALERMNALPSAELLALDHDGMMVLEDMVRELHEYRAAIAEATSDEFREMLEARFAESSGAFGLTIGRFVEKSSEAVGDASRKTDIAIKQWKRANSLRDILDAVNDMPLGGGS